MLYDLDFIFPRSRRGNLGLRACQGLDAIRKVIQADGRGHMHAGARWRWEPLPEAYVDLGAYVHPDVLGQVRELATRYGGYAHIRSGGVGLE